MCALLCSLSSFAYGQNDLLYFISDDNNTLYSINRTNGTVTEIGATGRSVIEAIAYYPIPGSETLYAADAGDFGTLNLTTGTFTEIDEIDGGGTADGSAGAQTLNDVDGLMLDGQTLIMWAVERNDPGADLLFQIDLTTGQFVPDAFGSGVDYLEITGTGIDVDVDDLAVDPISGEIYGVSNDAGSGDALIKVNKTTGEFEFVVSLAQDDVEGLAFHNDGKLYGSEGDGDNRLSLINKSTGAMTNFFSFSPGGDVEGLAALVAPANLIEGAVFEDDDLDGINDVGETGLANVTVYLYLDQDGDGQIDPEDTRIQTTTTDVNGDYSFTYITTGNLLTRTEFSSYPAGYSLTTDNIETISFTDGINFGETDSNNDFGLGTGSDCDGDGLTDFFEGTGDADGDGILNQCDLDSDNDGIRDDIEGSEDFDDDGIPNYLDRDSDDDGIPDAIEANGGIRPVEYVASQGNLSGPVGTNGIVDTRESVADNGTVLTPNPDSDGDTYRDYLDLDSDNDGILDLREAGGTVDTNKDGQVDNIVDANGNGYADTLESSPFAIPNSDVGYENTNGLTQRPNYIDIDSDADGIDDTREGLSTLGYRFPTLLGDNDQDGILNFWDVSNGVDPIVPVDTDGDGNPDYTDTNSDNDPESDFIEGNDADNNGSADETNTGLDANGNGLDDRFDTACSGVYCRSDVALPDTDTDGEDDFRDFEGVAVDTDGDGVPDATDIDDDNDGILDVDESEVLDTDGDGIPNSLDLDSDNDGILDIIEAGGVDTDEDGRVDGSTFGSNGWEDTYDNIETTGTPLPNPDTDGDGINNFLDLDSDGDGVVDLIESQATTATPIIPTGFDSDGDGIDNAFDVTGGTPIDPEDTDTDSDGTPDYLDLDSDNDGFSDLLEAWDTDGDGIANVNPTGGDLDVDGLDNAFDNVTGPNSTTNVYNNEDAEDFPNQDIPGTNERDWREDNAVDSDGDGQINSIDIDDDDDGILDVDEGNGDFDNDGIINSLDLDSDNDGIPDIIEAGGVDTNNDGRVDDNTDTDNDGWANTFDSDNGGTALAEPDTDSDGLKNYVDIDSDGDGIVDLIESQATTGSPNTPSGTDTDLDGLDNTFDINNGGTPTSPIDTDVDLTPDYIDVNSDGDGFSDLLEGWDTNGDLTADVVPSGNDTDADGLDDAFDDVIGPNNTTNSTNSETAFSFPDVTTAGDSERDWRESNALDSDFDGVPDVDDIDDDNDGILDVDEGSGTTRDTDGDGIEDRLDLDSDNDGIPDIIEAGGVDTNNDGRVEDDTDTDGDGWANTFDSDNGGVALVDPDSDNDGLENYIDLDSDNDGIEDIIEAGGVDTNDDGSVDSFADADADGWADTFDSDNAGTALPVPDTDADGLENYIDIDSDADGIVDLIESQATTATPIIPAGTDTDGDGIDNAFDSDNSGTPITPVDTDSDSTPDYIDFNSDNDSFSDALEGWDTDFDQVADTTPDGLDSDGDGLDDAFDDVVGPNATNNVYNDQNAEDFPKESVVPADDRSWREENVLDADFDGIPDGTDIDDDNDGILDVDELGDSDGDGIVDRLDLDSDNDGIPDIIEAGGVDTDNDGRVDVDTDTDGDGWANTFDSDNGGTALTDPDSDNDGVENRVDLDSDNDGILDVIEANNTDANGDGIIDGFLDADGDGYDDTVEASVLVLPNSDLTYENSNGLPNLPNYIDIDSDADGIDDTREGYSTLDYEVPTDFTDTDGDGILNFWDTNSGNLPITPVDTDGAGLDDYVDANSDNDSRSDFIEGNDFNEDGVADVANTGLDANGNGLDDAFDQDCYGVSFATTSTDYAEEQDDNNSVNLGSPDLELSNDAGENSSQTVGVYFPNINIPQGETINSAFIQFQVDEVTTGAITITIQGELSTNASTFTATSGDVSDRLTPGTTASESWSPADWNSTGEAGAAQRTVDISSIIEEIIGQGGWSSGNAIAIIFTGPDGNRRTAENNPSITINYGSGITFCSSNVAVQDADLDGEKDWRDSNGVEAPVDTDADGIPDIDDIDDDNDGILDTDEGCTDVPVVAGTATAASEIVAEVDQPGNAIDGDGGTRAELRDDGAVIELELRSGSIVTTGTVVTINAERREDDTQIIVTESTDGVTFNNAIEYSFAGRRQREDIEHTLASDATHIRIETTNFDGNVRVYEVDYAAFTILCTGNDTDSDGIPDHLDIDADGDGIVDLIESQATTGTPVVPLGVDTDGDGLDDAFDSDCAPCGAVTGVPTVLTDTDGDTVFDFLDFNSDGDTFSDLLEGWDTDGNLVANITPSGVDADNDGLDDAFDLVNGINSTTNVYNTQNANDFPDQTTQGNVERDWREENVADSDFDGIQDTNDIDDDNDGILDVDEGCVDNPDAPVNGVDSGDGGVPAGDFPLINDEDFSANAGIRMNAIGEYIIIDLGSELPADVEVVFSLWKNNDNNKTLRFAQLPNATVDLGGGTNPQTIDDTDITSVTSFTYTLDVATRYIQVEMTSRSGGRIEVVEATIQAYTVCIDSDGDGIEDRVDLDSDNDGIPDIIEAGGVDSDNDGRVDNYTEAGTNGWADTFDNIEGAGTPLADPDTDNDGIDDRLDLDSDNDGIEDIIEAGGVDTDDDGVVDDATDLDEDGWANTFDSDNSGTALPYPDTDGDGIRNNLDIDADGDGIVDLIESQTTTGTPVIPGGTDSDSDGIDNAFDTTGGTPTTPIDTDGDGTPDYLDFNSDGDSRSDLVEGYDTDGDFIANTTPSGTDTDGDGLDDNFDTVVGPNSTTNVYNNEDALDFPDVTTAGGTDQDWREVNVIDTDGDGVADVDDIDDDNDGILDVDESCTDISVLAGTATDATEIVAEVDSPENAVDADDGTRAELRDDGAQIEIELRNGSAIGLGTVIDIRAERREDDTQIIVTESTDGITFNNAETYTFAARRSIEDIEHTLATNATHLRITTTNFDGNVRLYEVDYPANTIPCDGNDTDADGIPDHIDLDSDNDGIPDIVEAGGVDTDNDGRVDTFAESDGDGWANTFDNVGEASPGTPLTDPDTDSDGLENRIDIDSDADGIPDLIESQATTATPVVPVGADLDEDGIDDAFDVNCTPCGGVTGVPTSIVNTDGTDNPDYIDTDSDNDGLSDFIEAYDTDGDYIANELPNDNDDDNDGLDDNFDNVVGPAATANSDNNQTSNTFPDVTTPATTERDWRESNAEVCDPGGVDPEGAGGEEFLLWLRADQGGTSWRDVSNNYVTVSSVGPVTTGDNINFNPSNFFGGSSYYNTTLDINADTHPDLAVIVVYQPTQDNAGAVWGEDNGGFDRYILDNNGAGENNAVSNGTGNTSDITGLYSVGTTTISAVLFDEDQASGSTVYLNGSNTLTNFTADHGGETSNNLQIGAIGDATDRFNGIISEVIVYNSLLTNATDLQQIQSYLALKYGVTLSSDTDGDAAAFEAGEGDYIASDGSILFWDASDNATYHNNVAGIGRDDDSCLNQKQSQSENSDAIVAIGLDGDTNGLEASNAQNTSTFAAGINSLMWGHDNAPLYNQENREFDPNQVQSRLNREWKAREVGTVGTVTVRFDVRNLIGPDETVGTNDESQIVLLVDADGDFTTDAQVITQSFVVADDGFVSFQVDFTDNTYFTLGSGQRYALPITLLSFEAEQSENDILVEWATVTEENNSQFQLQKLIGSSFQTIARIDGAGTSFDINNYSYVDTNPNVGYNFYRLVDIATNGDENISEVINVVFKEEINLSSPYPNPVSQGDKIYLDLPSDLEIQRLMFADMKGVMLSPEFERERNKLAISTNRLKQGAYIIQAIINEERFRWKVIVR